MMKKLLSSRNHLSSRKRRRKRKLLKKRRHQKRHLPSKESLSLNPSSPNRSLRPVRLSVAAVLAKADKYCNI